MSGNSWVTLATNDSYCLGALVLARSLKRVGTAYSLTVLITPGVSAAMKSQLASIFNLVEEVDILDSKDEKNLTLLTRPELGVTFTKLHCWRLTQFSKCVFLDADVLVLRNCDELFDREELSAAPDVGWPDCFNSGVFVYRPSIETYNALISFALSQGSFDGGDQGLLNQFFSDWATKDISKHLPFIYNMCSSATYSYLPAFKQFGESIKIVHFIGSTKPWLQYLDSETKQVRPSLGSEHLQGLLQLWWDIFCNDIHSTLSSEMAGLAGALSQLTLGIARSPEQNALEEHLRKQAWELGNIDYMGRDSFDNIWRKICQTLAEAPSAEPHNEKNLASSQKYSIIESISPGDTPTVGTLSEPDPISKESISKDNNIIHLADLDSISLSQNSYSSAQDVPSDLFTCNISIMPSENQIVSTQLSPDENSSCLASSSLGLDSQKTSSVKCESESNAELSKFSPTKTLHSEEVVQSIESPLHTDKEKQQINYLDSQIDLDTDSRDKSHPSSNTVVVESSIQDIPIVREVSSELPEGTVEIRGSVHSSSRVNIAPRQMSNASQESTSVPLTSELFSSVSSSLPLESTERSVLQAESYSPSEKVLGTLPKKSPTQIRGVFVDSKLGGDGSPNSPGEPSLNAQKVMVTEPTPPTSPTDNSSGTLPSPSSIDALSVEHTIPDTPPIGVEIAGVTPTKCPVSICAGVSISDEQSVDSKAPIPPKRRHRPSQNSDKAGSKFEKNHPQYSKGKK